jgi:hypothetical protein
MIKNKKVPINASLLFAFCLSVLLGNNKLDTKIIFGTYGDFIIFIFVNFFAAFLLILSFYYIIKTANTAEACEEKVTKSVPAAHQINDDGEHPMHNSPRR